MFEIEQSSLRRLRREEQALSEYLGHLLGDLGRLERVGEGGVPHLLRLRPQRPLLVVHRGGQEGQQGLGRGGVEGTAPPGLDERESAVGNLV